MEDLIFSSKATKQHALIREIKAVHKLRRPILIGTFTVKEYMKNHPPPGTYVVNDNPFQNQLGIFLSSNMGFQVDLFSVPVLFLIGFVNKILRKIK